MTKERESQIEMNRARKVRLLGFASQVIVKILKAIIIILGRMVFMDITSSRADYQACLTNAQKFLTFPQARPSTQHDAYQMSLVEES